MFFRCPQLIFQPQDFLFQAMDAKLFGVKSRRRELVLGAFALQVGLALGQIGGTLRGDGFRTGETFLQRFKLLQVAGFLTCHDLLRLVVQLRGQASDDVLEGVAQQGMIVQSGAFFLLQFPDESMDGAFGTGVAQLDAHCVQGRMLL